MKQLDKTKAYDLSNLNDEELRQVAKYVFKNKSINQSTLCSINDTINWFIKNEGKLLNHDKELWCFSYTDFNKVDAKELFEEWKPKQGDVVRVDDENYKCIGVFVCAYKSFYLIDNNGTFLCTNKIKPFEYLIKVGDWVWRKNEDIFKVNETHRLENINSAKNLFSKITNPELIELLEQEFKTK